MSSDIQPVAVQRSGLGYNDINYSKAGGHISASAFRTTTENIIKSGHFLSNNSIPPELEAFMSETLPAASAHSALSGYNRIFPVFNDDMFTLIRYAILMNRSHLEDFCDFTPSLSNRIQRLLDKEGTSLFSGSYEDFILRIKTKDMTAARIKRAMLHLLTGYTDEACRIAVNYLRKGYSPYARILALSPSGQTFIGAIKKAVIQFLSTALANPCLYWMKMHSRLCTMIFLLLIYIPLSLRTSSGTQCSTNIDPVLQESLIPRHNHL